MILAFDTYYTVHIAKTVCLQFNNWADETPANIYTEILPAAQEYIPGEFYKRELPCIISLLKQINIAAITAIIVDGFVVLDDDGKPGLGAYLYNYLHQKIPVIGVAKTNFATLKNCKIPVSRGESIKPLYITAIGIDVAIAAENIKNMGGDFRMPTLLKQLDSLTKE